MRKFHDGREDRLTPLESLDLDAVDSFADLLHAMRKTAFGGRNLGQALDVLVEMTRDPRCQVILTLSGAMTIAKMGRIVCKMIDSGMVQGIVSTGALITHGLSESIGLVHYEVPPEQDDKTLYEKGYNRVYDTLEMEQNLSDVQLLVHECLESLEGEPLHSESICRAIGKKMAANEEDTGILKSAYLKGVPVFIPAFTDCELGLDVAAWSLGKKFGRLENISIPEAMSTVPEFNPFHDLNSYTRFLFDSEVQGIFTIGGGVPRNWAQQVGPYYDLLAYRLGLPDRQMRFKYGVRICPEPVHWGGLSGCTYSEGVSWGKFAPPSEGGRFAEVYADATIAWPILIKAALEILEAKP